MRLYHLRIHFYIHIHLHLRMMCVRIGQESVTGLVDHNEFTEDVGVWVSAKGPEWCCKLKDTSAIFTN